MLLFGPKSGIITHKPDDRFLEVFRGPYTAEDVLVEATFYNPYGTGNAYWDHGFLLRDRVGNHQHWVSIDRNGNWEHFHRLGEARALDRVVNRSSDINTEPGGKNHIGVVMTGATGRVFINGKYQGSLDLSAITGAGRISVFLDDELAGDTRFEDFTVWRWSEELASQLPLLKYPRRLLLFGPESGVITHEPDDRFLEVFTGPYTAEDVLVEATFYNPYNTRNAYWEHGFLLRQGGSNYQHWVSIDRDGYWTHFHRLGESKALDRTTERSPDINTAPGGKNDLSVVMTGTTGRVFINGKYQDELDFSAITGAGRISVFLDDEWVGSTRFGDFTVWRWDEELVRLSPDLDTPEKVFAAKWGISSDPVGILQAPNESNPNRGPFILRACYRGVKDKIGFAFSDDGSFGPDVEHAYIVGFSDSTVLRKGDCLLMAVKYRTSSVLTFRTSSYGFKREVPKYGLLDPESFLRIP